MTLRFEEISTWAPDFVAAIRRHYPGSRGAPYGKKIAWRIYEDGIMRGWIGIGEPSFKLAPRRRLGIEDARPLPHTVNNFIFRLEAPGNSRASDVLKEWHQVAAEAWLRRYGWAPEHWETLIQCNETQSEVCGASYRRAGYRHIGPTTGRSARRPAGHTHSARVWVAAPVKELFYRGPLARIPFSGFGE